MLLEDLQAAMNVAAFSLMAVQGAEITLHDIRSHRLIHTDSICTRQQ